MLKNVRFLVFFYNCFENKCKLIWLNINKLCIKVKLILCNYLQVLKLHIYLPTNKQIILKL